MKKIFSLLLAVLLLVTAFSAVLSVSADEVEGQTEAPDWLITEICCDNQGKDGNTNGYTADISADCFEFIEIYNNSGRELNLYEYAVTYNGSARDSDKFEHQITEYTPIKPGDYLDGSNLVPTEAILPFGDLSNKPVNPDTCTVAPGEVVVLWMVYLEAYQARFNDGKGMSVADFRAHWDVPENVKVIAVDANGNVKNGGHEKNFNVKNSKVGTYGIAKQSDEFNAACNVDGSSGIDGNYWENDHLSCWATVDFTDMAFDGSVANTSFHFTVDFGKYATIDQAYTYIKGEDYVYDARRGYLLNLYHEPAVGTLTVLQKMTLGIELAAGESYCFDEATMYYPFLDEVMKGYVINGEVYKDDTTTFTAEEAGVYIFDFFFPNRETEAPTEAPTEPMTESPTEEPSDEDTKAPTDTPSEDVTEAPTSAIEDTEAPTEAPTNEPAKDGCGSVLGPVILPCILAPMALLFRKKRED